MAKYGIKSYELSINGEKFGETMCPIDTIIRALKLYETKYGGTVTSLRADKTVLEIIEDMIE